MAPFFLLSGKDPEQLKKEMVSKFTPAQIGPGVKWYQKLIPQKGLIMKNKILLGITITFLLLNACTALKGGSVEVKDDSVVVSADIEHGDSTTTVTIDEKME